MILEFYAIFHDAFAHHPCRHETFKRVSHGVEHPLADVVVFDVSRARFPPASL